MLTLQISLSHPVPSELWFYGRDLLNLSVTPPFMSLRYWIWYCEHSVKNWSFLKAFHRPPHMTHSGTWQTYLTGMDFFLPQTEWNNPLFYSQRVYVVATLLKLKLGQKKFLIIRKQKKKNNNKIKTLKINIWKQSLVHLFNFFKPGTTNYTKFSA